MRAYIFVFLVSLLIPVISFADSGTAITFTDGRQITADSCTIEGDNIFYTVKGKSHHTTFNDVESLSSFSGPLPEIKKPQVVSNTGRVNEPAKSLQKSCSQNSPVSKSHITPTQRVENRVNSKDEQEIKRAWNGMRTALRKGDVDAAASHFTSSSRENYRTSFSELKKAGVLPEVASGMGEAQVDHVYDDMQNEP